MYILCIVCELQVVSFFVYIFFFNHIWFEIETLMATEEKLFKLYNRRKYKWAGGLFLLRGEGGRGGHGFEGGTI